MSQPLQSQQQQQQQTQQQQQPSPPHSQQLQPQQSSQHHRSVSASSSSTTQQVNRNIIASHYQIAQKIGEGSFGIIFKGYDLLRDNQPVAIKFESKKSEAPQLRDEFKAYKILNSSINKYIRDGPENDPHHYLSIEGIPKVYYFGQEGYYNILIIQLLGPSLEDLFEWCGRKFSVKTVAQLAKQMIQRIQFVHENDLIYRDIKPDNFLIGSQANDNLIYLVDFGMIKQYRNPETKQHIPYRERKSLSGTARYMSINTHLGREQSRRDDLESLGHVFLYFLKGELPWQGLKAPTNKLKYEKIGEKKQSTSVANLCYKLPKQFQDYLAYVRNLRFEEEPDYVYLINLMDGALSEVNEVDDGFYDWMKLNDGKGWDWNKNKKINLNGYGSNNQTNRNQSVPQAQQTAQQVHAQYNSNNKSGSFKNNTNRRHSQNTGGNNVLQGNQYKVDENTRLLPTGRQVGAPSRQYGSGNQQQLSGYDQHAYENEEGVCGFWRKLFCCCC